MINTASFVAVMGAATSQISYTASKGGVLALSRELGVEFATPAACASTRCARARSTRRCCASCSPRIPSRPRGASSTCRWAASVQAEEIANAALFLASDESIVHDRLDVPRRRRHQRRVHDAALVSRSADSRAFETLA